MKNQLITHTHAILIGSDPILGARETYFIHVLSQTGTVNVFKIGQT